ncbi:MAG: acyl-ACP thioesterase domain-containing protein [Actinomycetota bacterium]
MPVPPMDPQVAGAVVADDGRRQFTGIRKVRLGDASPLGRLRLDALTRYTQDVSDDDTTDAGLDVEPSWVVRRTAVTVTQWPRLAETLTITTWCSGLGGRWAERSLDVVGSDGGRCHAVTLWICVDRASSRPARLTDQFQAIYGPAAGGRTVKARLHHGEPPDSAPETPWLLRATDHDVYGHVNNAAYWALAEEWLAADGADEAASPREFSVEYRSGLPVGTEPTVRTADTDDGARTAWWCLGDEVAASLRAG